MDAPTSVEIAIVGAGFSGVGLAIRLLQEGRDDFVVLDRGDDVGGTWRDNSYPGAACDVPSHLYSYSFAPNPRWTRAFSPQAEIQSYLQGCVDRFGVRPFVRTRSEVLSATWDEASQRWLLQTASGDVTARVLVWATGPLSEPRTPDFPGLAGFGGEVFHSADWDHDYDLAGKTVAVVGTGASAIQFVPQIQPKVERLYLFQRTPPWVLPRRDRAFSRRAQWLFEHVPPLRQALRLSIYLRFELLLAALVGTNLKRRQMIRTMALRWLESQVADPELRARLTPDYEPGCKRILVSDDYYQAVVQPNVELVTHPVTDVGAGGILDETGAVRPVDAVIFGTGFQAAEPSFATRITGPDGIRLSTAWNEGVEAYLGSAVAGFPNLFFLIGPNTTLGHNSMIYMIESQLNYVMDALSFLGRPGVGTVAVRPAVEARYNHSLQERLEGSVWVTGGCRSWYLDHRGRNTTLWPDHTWRFRRLTRHFHPGDYDVRPPVPGRVPALIGA